MPTPIARSVANALSMLLLLLASVPLRGADVRVMPTGLGSIYSMAFSPDSKQLACGSYRGRVAIWNHEDGKVILLPERWGGSVSCLCFSQDGNLLVLEYSGSDVWDIKKGELTRLLHKRFLVDSLPGEDIVLALNNDASEIEFWDINRAKQLHDRTLKFNPMGELTFSPDKTTLVNFVKNPNSQHYGKVSIWNLNTEKEEFHEQAKELVGMTTGVFSPTGDRFAAAFNYPLVWFEELHRAIGTGAAGPVVLRFWRTMGWTRDGELKLAHEGMVESLAFSPDGKSIACAVKVNGKEPVVRDGVAGRYFVDIYDVRSLKLQGTLKFGDHREAPNTILYSPDGKWLATGASDGTVKLWKVSEIPRLWPVLDRPQQGEEVQGEKELNRKQR